MTNYTKRIFSVVLSTAMALTLFVMPVAKAAVNGWNTTFSGGAQGSVEVDNEIFYSGDGAMRIINNSPKASDVYISAQSEVSLQAGKKYYIYAQVKSKRSTSIQFLIDWEKRYYLTPFGNTYDWTNFEFTYTATSTRNAQFRVLCEGASSGLWVDDLKFIDAETGENLIANGTFDSAGGATNSSGQADGSLEALYNKIRVSDSFSESDIVSVRGAFKYMPVYEAKDIVIDGDASDWEDYPEMSMPTLKTQYQVYMNDGKDKDVKAKCKFASDDENFYIFIEVIDDKFVYITGENGYWKGDSIQLAFSGLDEIYGSELGFAHNPDTNKGEIYGSGFSQEAKDQMELSTSQHGNTTVYEAKIPWKVKFSEKPANLLFDFLVNDNDGDGRRYCLELAPGISEGKSNTQFPLLEILDNQKDWYGWIQGNRTGFTDSETKFDYYLVNSGEEKTFLIENESDNKTEEVVVPAHSGIRREIVHTFAEPGMYTVQVKFKTGADSFTSSASTVISRKPPNEEYAQNVADKLKKRAEELSGLLDKCEIAGIATDYERVNFRIIERFAGYVLDDIKNKDLTRIYYTEDTTDELYNESKASLEAYLLEDAEPKLVPKFVTSDMTIDGKATYAMTEMDGLMERRPVFFVGYGHFDQARRDIPVFNEWGVNTIQNEIGPSHAMVNGYWQKSVGAKPEGKIETTTEDVIEGKSALKLSFDSAKVSNQFLSLVQSALVTPGKTYVLHGYVKADKASGVWISANDFDDRNQLAGDYDWKEFLCEYTAPAGKNATSIRILIENVTAAIYFDDISFCEKGTSENLLQDGGFELFGESSGWTFNEKAVRVQQLMQTLETAEESNIAVSVLVSPHYFPQAIIDEYGIASTSSGFLKYNVNAPIARELIETYLRSLIPLIKDYKSLNNICITNEPQFSVNGFGDFYLEDWHEFLKEVYDDDIMKLNTTYLSSFQSFDEINLTANALNPAKLYDYKRFNDKVFSEWHIWMAGIIREIAPDIPLHTKIMGYTGSDNRRAAYSYNGTGYQDYYEAMDLNGCDYWNYPDDDQLPLIKEMFYDYLCSMKDVPVINSEDHIIPDRNTNFSLEVADYVAQDIYQGAIHGRYMSDIWIWERTYDHASDFWGSILFRPDAIAKTSKAALDLNRLAYEIVALQNEVPEIGIIYSDSTMLNNGNAMHAAYAAYAAAMFNGKRAKFIVDSQFWKMNDCKLVIVPNVTQASEDTLIALKSYIQKGGRVLIMGEGMLSKNEHNLDHDTELVSFITSNSKVIPYVGSTSAMISPTNSEFYAIVREELKDIGIYYVSVVDAQTGEPVDDLEYNLGVYEGEMLINLSNFAKDKAVKVYVNGKPVSQSVELRSGDEMDEVIIVKQYTSITLKAKVDNVFFDTYGHWAENDIITLSNQGIVSGMSESRYAPNANVTRAEFLALLVRGAGYKKTDYKNNMQDVKGADWFASTIATAVNEGIVEANTAFRPNERITREEMCELLIKCYEHSKGSVKGLSEAKFTDWESVSDKEAVSKATYLKLMIGDDDGAFRPTAPSTRAEAAAVIVRYMILIPV